jgi:hypothetical protein
MTADDEDIQKRLEAFAADIYAACEKHGMAIFCGYDEVMRFIPWAGWQKGYEGVNPVILSGPMIEIEGEIIPGGFETIEYKDGHL